MEKNSRIFVAGHNGLVGSAILRKLNGKGYGRIIARSHNELDLAILSDTEDFFKEERPEYIFLAAAKVGGICANNSYPVDFFLINSMISNNVIQCAYKYGAKKLLVLGSSCIYPRSCPQPIKEEYLLSGALEPTNEAYALAKISAIRLCHYYRIQYGAEFISCIPSNLYGPDDNFDLNSSHVLPAMIRKFHEAKMRGAASVTLWGTGTPLREFMHVDDMADAALFLMGNYSGTEHVNIGTGKDISIKDLAALVKDTVGFSGKLLWDHDKPNGMARKLLDVSKLTEYGWRYSIELSEGLKDTYEWYKRQHPQH